MMHSIPLPDLGSIKYYIIQEGIKRERSEKLSFAKYLGGLASLVFGVDQSKIDLLLAEYSEQLQQLIYNTNYETIRSRITAAHQAALAKDKSILDKVAKMTVKE